MSMDKDVREKMDVTKQSSYPIEPVDGALVEPEPENLYQVKLTTILAVIALSWANNCAALSNTVNTTIKFQVAALGEPELAPWLANSNFVVTLAIAPVFGFLSDRLGKKWFLVLGSIMGMMGAVISGSAHKTTTIIIGNCFIGLGNAGCIMGIPAAQEVTPNRLRPWTMGFSQFFASIVVVTGTLAAGAFVKYHSFRWAYYLNAFHYGASAILVFAFYHPPPTTLRRQMAALKEIAGKIDYVGIVLFSGSIASLIIALTWGGQTYPWSAGRVVAPLTIGAIGLVAFGFYERLGYKEGILDHRMFITRNFPILLIVCVIDGMLLLGVNVMFSQQVAALYTHDAVKIATVLTPYLATSAFGCFPAGAIMARTKSYRTLLVGALFWCSLWSGLMALQNQNRLSWAYTFSSLLGIGTAVTTTIPVVALVLSVPSFLLGAAGTLSVACRALGGIIGITTFTAILNNKMATELPRNVLSVLGPAGQANLTQAVIKALKSTQPTALGMVPNLPKNLIPQLQLAQTNAQVYSYKYVWIAISVFIAANAILACALEPVHSKMNNHIESALEESTERKKQMTMVPGQDHTTHTT
ncbi:MFS general substrate transporter [Microthyrium microscopicum]|uniref:MFS general substrate transporter n=1 Tax=Microthyrium microscopicum TaxID=703497 RepID=A0A6A6TZI2_9PEZI|nr:MFS general substrate transporter [Microthyrium microscopicum]